MNADMSGDNAVQPELVSLSERQDAQKPQAWEMIENGRYRPRRIKGSLLGRDLG